MKSLLRNLAVEQWLFVDGAETFGGHEVMLLRLLEELRAQGRIDLTLLARAETRLRAEAAAFAKVETLPRMNERHFLGEKFHWLTHMLRDARSFVSVLRRLRPRLCIVAEGCLLSQPIFVLVARCLRVPVLVYVPLVESSSDMGFRSGRMRDFFVRFFYGKLPTAWIVITREQARQLVGWAKISAQIFTLANAITTQIEQAAFHNPASIAPPFEQSTLRVLVLGRFDDRQKGLDLLFDFLEREPAAAAGLHFSLVGAGPYENEMRRRLAANSKLRDIVSIHPWADTAVVMSQHDVLLLVSRFEGVPLVILEAMALGVPVVATDLPGTRGLLSSDCLFPVGDVALAFRLIRRCCRTTERALGVARNREFLVANASAAAFSIAVSALTENLLGLTSRRRLGARPKEHAVSSLKGHV